MTEPDDRYGDALRRALRAEADRISPSGDGLERIRARTSRRTRPWWQPALAALSAAAVVGVGAGAAFTALRSDQPAEVGLAATGSPTSEHDTSSADTSPERTASPVESPTDTPIPTGDPTPSESPYEVFVYYLGETGSEHLGLRLFRELRYSAPAEDRLTAAVETMLSLPLDRDYSTLWAVAEMELLEPVEVEGDTATVNVTKGKVTLNIERDAAAKSIQQLVYTVTASGKERGVNRVRLLVEGEEVSELFGEPLEQPLTRAPRTEMQALNWILAPKEGETVPTTFRIEGYGNYSDGNAVWQILGGERVVEDGFETVRASQGVFGQWKSKAIMLDPGTYIVKTIGGFGEGEGSAPEIYVDTKTITVE